MTFDVQATRARFPALQQDQVFMDNAGGSQVLDSVAESVANYYKTNNVQLGASYRISRASTQAYADGYEAAGRYMNAKPSDIGR